MNSVPSYLNRTRLNTGEAHPSFLYAVPAMAVDAPELPSLDFQKYSTPGPFLALISKAQDAANGKEFWTSVVAGSPSLGRL